MAKRAPHSASIWLDWLGLHHQNYNILQLRTLATNLEHVPHWDIGHQIQAEFIIFDLTRVLIFRNSKAIQLRLQDISRLGLEVPSRIFCRVSLRFHRYLNHCVASQVKNKGGYTAYELSLRGGETGAQFPDDPRWLDLALQETMGNHGKAPFIGGKASAQFPSFPQSFFLKKNTQNFTRRMEKMEISGLVLEDPLLIELQNVVNSISKYPDISPDWVSRNRAHHGIHCIH